MLNARLLFNCYSKVRRAPADKVLAQNITVARLLKLKDFKPSNFLAFLDPPDPISCDGFLEPYLHVSSV